MTIWFDMDGTLADLYNVTSWLESLRAEDATPYRQAAVMHNMSQLAKLLRKAQAIGYKIGIISWLPKMGSANYNKLVMQEKRKWLATHLHSVQFDYIHIVPYGTPKQNFANTIDDILFDDEKINRNNWIGKSFTPEEIISVMKRF